MIDLDFYSYRAILARMLSRIPDSLDKREGSVIFDAMAPAAYELADLYEALYAAYEDTFLYTAKGDALDKRGEELGLPRKSAVKAVRKGVFADGGGLPMDIDLGSRFSTMDPTGSQNFLVVEKMAAGVYRMEAEDAGSHGNRFQGDLMGISHIAGLGSGVLTDILIPGEEEEDDEIYRARVVGHLKNEMADGNIGQYIKWAAEYDGIGQAKVFPCWNGANTVRVSILDSLNRVASPVLVADFQAYLDPGGEGLGNGAAPIGAKVTVSTASTKEIGVGATVAFVAGYGAEQAVLEAESALTAFFADTAYRRGQVNHIEIGAVLLACASISAVRELTVNGYQADVALAAEEIPVLAALQLTEVLS